jgi:hypothetical protein
LLEFISALKNTLNAAGMWICEEKEHYLFARNGAIVLKTLQKIC